MAVRLRLAPRDREFFNLFEEAGANIQRAGGILSQLMKKWPDAGGLGRELLICEQEGDRITPDIIHRLNSSSSATPIDRVDIYELATALDDVIDYTEEAADFLGLYHVEAPMEQAQELADVLRDATLNLGAALVELRQFDLRHYFTEIKRLENEGDRIVREALGSLFATGIDPMVVIRWKDIFERLEQAIDACEHASNILEGICVKHA
jgi:predicted phosphate transport protein (TIGR00153 family)